MSARRRDPLGMIAGGPRRCAEEGTYESMSLVEVTQAADGVVRVMLNRPEKRNALTAAMRDELMAALDRLASDETVRVVILTGAGPMFCAGFDLAEMRAARSEDAPARMVASDRFHHGILRFPLPVVVALNGPAIGGGFDVALLADLRIAADTASFSHPEHAWGEVIYRPLRDLVGGAIARDLVLTGRTVDPTEALAIGLVTSVVAADGLEAASTTLAATIAEAPRPVLLAMKAKFLAATGIPRSATTLEL